MGARILVHSGIAAGTVHWIERKVVRIGSDPIMEITIPSDQLAGHALTLEYRDDGYHVHNRSQQMVHLGGRTIAQNATERWSDSDLLECGGSIQLALELDGDPAPSVRPSPSVQNAQDRPLDANQVLADSTISDSMGRPTGSQTTQSKQTARSQGTPRPEAKSQSTLVQVAVIVVCVLLCGLLLIRDQLKKNDPAVRDLPSFTEVVRQGLEDEQLSESPLLRQFQYAEAAVIRGNKTKARRWYGQVRSRLISEQAKSEDEISDAQRAMLRWVEYRLGQLS